ncbi:trace amine-associated receptor 4-like [Lethenteron reissneri]|uniref:trace amine-associated receptor 4-like n=1 Tax=Lethenteron reissneri TaxID=7753 RepID=UPI002AB5F3A8|nr:trace amine-associated receptor 4-like [Lethenteron reissneri]
MDYTNSTATPVDAEPGPTCVVLQGGFNCTGPGPLLPPSPSPLAALALAAALLLSVAAVLGNALVVLAVAYFARLQSPTNALALSLAVADLLVGAVVVPFSATRAVRGCWFHGATFCRLHTCLDVMLSTASIVHLSCIAFDRYVAICDPLRYTARVTSGTVAAMLVACWLGPLLYVAPIMLGLQSVGAEALLALACPDDCPFVMSATFSLAATSCSFVAPMIIMLAAYARIYRVARRHARSIALRPPAPPGGSDGAKGMAAASSSSSAPRRWRQEYNATKTLGVILGAFFALWLPFFSAAVADGLPGGPRVDGTTWHCVTWLGYVNSAVNPLLYASLNRAFRRAFGILFSPRELAKGRRNADFTD